LIISEGSLVLFFFNSDKKWLIRIENEKKLHTHLGIIDAGSTIGLEYGSHILTNKDKKIFLLLAITDFYEDLIRIQIPLPCKNII